MPENFVKVYLASGATDAIMIKLFLESLGIQAVIIYEEAIGAVYGLTIGPLAETEIWVPQEQAEAASELLRKMENGELSFPAGENLEIPEDLQDIAEENQKIMEDDDPLKI